MKIKHAISDKEKNELDRLLWQILWKPLCLPRNIRQSFRLNKPQIDLVAVDNCIIIGGLVANWLSDNEIEIRHIAVNSNYQKRSVGKLLVENLLSLIHQDIPVTIRTCARNTSVGFFTKLGFMSSGEYHEHPEFTNHGIKFSQMHLEVL